MAAKKEDKLERTYNVPLRSGFVNTPKHRRTKKAVSVLKLFVKKHMKTDDILIGQNLNKELWKNGIKNPPHHVKINVTKEDNIAKAELVGFEFKEEKRPEQPVQEENTLKDKLAAKLGVKDEMADKKKDDKPKQEESEKKTEEKKPEATEKTAPVAEKEPKVEKKEKTDEKPKKVETKTENKPTSLTNPKEIKK